MQWNLIKLRTESGLSQPDMARILNVNVNTYGKKERGEREFKLSEMIAIHKHFGRTLDEIFLEPECIKNAPRGGDKK